MGDDEAATVRTVPDVAELIAASVARHSGRIVDARGDNVLAQVASVVDAVAIPRRRPGLAPFAERRAPAVTPDVVPHRNNLGDMIVEGERVFGDGVASPLV